MTLKIFVAIIALGPSAFLIGWALWVYFKRSDDDFLRDPHDWGAQ